MYAIVDIETTGGHASSNGITEIAIILHNGHEEEGRFETLINPGIAIPRYITSLTGITNEMVYPAPSFESVAPNIFNLLQDKIFVAHNVNFDYSFIRHHLQQAGFELQVKKLCTVRLARKIFPGFQSYSLGNLCRGLGVTNDARHRAMGDAAATAEVFGHLIRHDHEKVILKMLKGKNKEQYLPPNLPAQMIDALPTTAGVYYFHDQKGKVIYVGKAVNLQARVKSHFTSNDTGKRRQDLLRSIYTISHQCCSSELAAFILESIEIRRIWPAFNRSQKKYHYEYGLYTYEDRNGYLRLFIEKRKKNVPCVYTFNLLHEGQVLLKKIIQEYELNESLCFVNKSKGLDLSEPASLYNSKVQEALKKLQEQLPTFLVADTVEAEEPNYILMEQGRFTGMGKLSADIISGGLNAVKENITPYPDNDYIRGLIYQHVEKHPSSKISIDRQV